MAAIKLPDLLARVRVDSKGVKTGLDDVESSVKKTESSFSGMGSTLTKVVGGGALLSFANQAKNLASDTAEASSKVGVVFGDARKNVDAFAASSAKAFGVSKREALDAAGTFGNLFVATGLAKDAAASMSVDVVKLAADLGSFNNLGTEEVLEKLRSGLVGEVEPLRALGINFNAAAVEAKAMQLGLADANGEINEGAKVQARYALILEQTKTAQGDFSRTADGMANSAKTAAAAAEDARAKFGDALAPTMAKVNGMLTTAVGGFNALPGPIQQTTIAVGLLSTALVLLAGRAGAATVATSAFSIAGSVAAAPFVGLAGAAVGLSAGLALLARTVDDNVPALARLDQGMINLQRRTPLVGDFLANLDEKVLGLGGKTKNTGRAFDEAAQNGGDFSDAMNKTAVATTAASAATDKQTAALEKLTTATLSQVSSQLGYEASINTLTDNINDIDDKTTAYTEAVSASAAANREADVAVRQYGAGSDVAKEAVEKAKDAAKDAEDANRALRDAHLGVEQSAVAAANAAVRLADDTATANGETLTGQERAAIFRSKLYELAESAGASRDEIRSLANNINNLQDKTVTIRVNTVAANQLEERLVPGRFRAHGGPVTAGRAYIVGEERPELFVPDVNGQILPRVPTTHSPGSSSAPTTSGSPPVVQTVIQIDKKTFATVMSQGQYENRRR